MGLVVLLKRWTNPDSGKEHSKGTSLYLHPEALPALREAGIIEQLNKVKVKKDK